MTKPRCFDSEEQWQAWRELAAVTKVPSKHGHCHDCTPAFHTEMLLQERCDHPNVVFIMAKDEGLVGRRLDKMGINWRNAYQRAGIARPEETQAGAATEPAEV